MITSERMWSSGNVRAACIRNRLYTNGNNKAYEHMLSIVDSHDPDPDILYTVAKDIKEHTKSNQTITNIMFILEKETVNTFYFIDGSDEV